MDCPLDCEFLAEGRRHERLPDLQPADIPNQDVRVTESFLREHEPLVTMAARLLFSAAAEVPGAIDYDVREAIAAMIKTLRTLDSGLIYETRPANPLAAAVQQLFEQRMQGWRQQVAQETGMNMIRDTDVLGAVVFLQRLEIQHNNGRRRGRAFLDLLRGFLPPPPAAEASNLVVA